MPGTPETPLPDAGATAAAPGAGASPPVSLTLWADDAATVLAAIPDQIACIATDATGTVTHWNPLAEVLYGWDASEAVGRNISTLTVGPVHQHQADEILASLGQGQAWIGTFSCRRKGGDLIDVHVLDVPLVDRAGKVVGVVGVSREDTDQITRSLAELDEMRELAGRIDEVRRREERRIAAQIHDEFSQRFHLVVQHTSALAELELCSEARRRVDALLVLHEELVAALGGIGGSLRPPLLDELGLRVALEHLCDSVSLLGPDVTSDLDAVLDAMDTEVAEVVMNATQECLANVVSHAGATTVTVCATPHPGGVQIQVTDDGGGFLWDDGAGAGFGLRLMGERVRRVGGELRVMTTPNTGTTIAFVVPVADPADESAANPAAT